MKGMVEKHDQVIFPEDPGNELVTVNMCLRCQADCKNSMISQIDKIAAHTEANVQTLCDIRESIGDIKGFIRGSSSKQIP